ncbi:MAG: hypothetical protein GPI90_03525 [Microcystis aeruginosa K13-05]|uniref:hypothetical protein n=1 Tax=unclassified Microcystis TaxID=2643300 RepID=UPI0022C4666C|nr:MULTISPECIES: hypothetical protein [unclassified Microcystis]MCE2662136.1 hypothetical protein [Microcystis sp. 53602_E8]MCZ8361303.1 hypothetical protein [Microcystis sp. LE19-251.1A]MDJ0566316.1 hypothetical protein [Microcystis sp. M49629_WE12]NCR79281.1 hypothetical protein [Microcystis aeruginosa K13-10]NCR83777.1 hypothetical protein [Microcystis aeruginosa K13-05]
MVTTVEPRVLSSLITVYCLLFTVYCSLKNPPHPHTPTPHTPTSPTPLIFPTILGISKHR